MQLVEHTTTTAAEALADASVAVLPTGSVEQHGPALPLGTDALVAEALAGTLAERDDAVVLPPVSVGVSEHHRQFHGTLWVSESTFEAVVRETLASAASHGLRKAVVVNGHGGNSGAIQRAARGLRREETAFAAPWDWWESCQAAAADLFESGGIGHADEMETSMVYAVAADLVREERLEAAEAGAADGWGRSVHGAQVGFDTADFSDSGAVGSPTEGSREAGQQLFDRASDELAALCDWLVERPFEELLPEDHR